MKEKILTTKIAVYSYNELTNEDKNLVEMAKNATKGSYSPYSHFCVGAALLLDNGVMLKGANQENAAFSSGTCAERSVIYYAGANYPGVGIKKLAVAAFTDGDFVENPVSPCGHCRQAIREYETISRHDIEILLCGRNEVYVLSSIKDLLPLCFSDF
ncbi:MAG: cytidine deaminase [Muribaculaceae bacterium]